MKLNPQDASGIPLAAAGGAGPSAPLPEGAKPQETIQILLVDDEPKNLTALETVLEDPGYTLVRANSADEALLALVAQDFAVIILDIQMPGMNGFELALMIRQRKRTSRIPIIFLTAYYSENEHVIEGYSTGAVDFLHKPINAVVLRSKVAVFADLHRKTQELESANRLLRSEMEERRLVETKLKVLNDHLEKRVGERTALLSLSEARFRALAEDMPHLVWELDPAGHITYHNARSEAYTGPLSSTGHKSWLTHVHPADAPPVEEQWHQAMDQHREFDGSARLVRAVDGDWRWFHIKAAPVLEAAGGISHWVATCTNIHQQRMAEDALRESDRRKDEFLAMLGHELRNPLAAIRHAVSISGESPGDGETLNWAAEIIDRQSLQLTRMVDDLLDVERINRGRIQLQFSKINLKDVLEKAVETVRPFLGQKEHSLTVIYPETVCSLNGDSTRLEQVFVNLLNNAAKYTPNGGNIELSVTERPEQVAVFIKDDGIGISPEIQPFVFDLFTQAQNSLDRAEGGLGIGLTVVRSLVESHGGTVEVLPNEIGKGSVFGVVLPAGFTRTPVEQEITPPPATVPSDKIKVLIVDDHLDGAQTLSRLLSRRNCETALAHDGLSGIAVAEDFKPDVLLLDLGLPGLDGYEVARRLRKSETCRDSLFIAISGYAQDTDKTRAHEAGFDHHCGKPVDLNRLMQLITGLNRPESE